MAMGACGAGGLRAELQALPRDIPPWCKWQWHCVCACAPARLHQGLCHLCSKSKISVLLESPLSARYDAFCAGADDAAAWAAVEEETGLDSAAWRSRCAGRGSTTYALCECQAPPERGGVETDSSPRRLNPHPPRTGQKSAPIALPGAKRCFRANLFPSAGALTAADGRGSSCANWSALNARLFSSFYRSIPTQ